MLDAPGLPARIPKAVREKYPRLDAVRTGHELMRRQITWPWSRTSITTTSARLARLKAPAADDVRYAGQTMVTFSPSLP